MPEADARIRQVEGHTRRVGQAAGLPPNPTLGYSRDGGRRGADATEQTLSLIHIWVDHGAIYLFIAGSYTPFALGVLDGPWGWTLFLSLIHI